MATDRDAYAIFNDAELLAAMQTELGNVKLSGVAPLELLALIDWKDRHDGASQEGDYILLDRAYAVIVFNSAEFIDDHKVRELREAAERVDMSFGIEEYFKAVNRWVEEASRPVKVTFGKGENTPPCLRGRTFSVASVREGEFAPVMLAASVRQDGTFINNPIPFKRKAAV